MSYRTLRASHQSERTRRKDDGNHRLGALRPAGYRDVVQDGQPGLAVEAEQKDYAPPTVHPAFVIDGSDYKNVLFEVGGRITFLDLGGFGSEWRNDFVAGSEYGLKTEYFHPFTSYTSWFVAVHGTADSSPSLCTSATNSKAITATG